MIHIVTDSFDVRHLVVDERLVLFISVYVMGLKMFFHSMLEMRNATFDRNRRNERLKP